VNKNSQCLRQNQVSFR